MKILFLSNLEYEGFAGPTYCIPALIAALSEYDEVIWYNMRKVERREWTNLPFYRDPSYFRFDIEDFCRAYWHPDLIVFEGFYAFHPNKTVLRTLLSGVPYVIEPHCALTVGDQGKKKVKKRICNALFYKHFARGAAAIHYLTDRERDESGLSWNSRCFIQPNGIDMPKEMPIRNEWQGNVPQIVFVGRVEPYQKGLDVLFDALNVIKKRADFPKFHLSVFGNSVDGSSERLQARIDAEGLAEEVSLHGPVYDAEKDAVLRAADFFILTSRYEGMPMALLEACAYGLPSIVTPGTNMASVISSDRAGWTCDLEQDSIAGAIESAISSHDDYAVMSLAAQRVASKYAWSSIANSVHDDYFRAVSNR